MTPQIRTGPSGAPAGDRVASMKMDVNVSLPRIAIVAMAALAIVLVVLLAWIGGEAHYGNCIERAALEHPAAAGAEGSAESSARQEAIDGCSRWP